MNQHVDSTSINTNDTLFPGDLGWRTADDGLVYNTSQPDVFYEISPQLLTGVSTLNPHQQMETRSGVMQASVLKDSSLNSNANYIVTSNGPTSKSGGQGAFAHQDILHDGHYISSDVEDHLRSREYGGLSTGKVILSRPLAGVHCEESPAKRLRRTIENNYQRLSQSQTLASATEYLSAEKQGAFESAGAMNESSEMNASCGINTVSVLNSYQDTNTLNVRSDPCEMVMNGSHELSRMNGSNSSCFLNTERIISTVPKFNITAASSQSAMGHDNVNDVHYVDDNEDEDIDDNDLESDSEVDELESYRETYEGSETLALVDERINLSVAGRQETENMIVSEDCAKQETDCLIGSEGCSQQETNCVIGSEDCIQRERECTISTEAYTRLRTERVIDPEQYEDGLIEPSPLDYYQTTVDENYDLSTLEKHKHIAEISQNSLGGEDVPNGDGLQLLGIFAQAADGSITQIPAHCLVFTGGPGADGQLRLGFSADYANTMRGLANSQGAQVCTDENVMKEMEAEGVDTEKALDTVAAVDEREDNNESAFPSTMWSSLHTSNVQDNELGPIVQKECQNAIATDTITDSLTNTDTCNSESISVLRTSQEIPNTTELRSSSLIQLERNLENSILAKSSEITTQPSASESTTPNVVSEQSKESSPTSQNHLKEYVVPTLFVFSSPLTAGDPLRSEVDIIPNQDSVELDFEQIRREESLEELIPPILRNGKSLCISSPLPSNMEKEKVRSLTLSQTPHSIVSNFRSRLRLRKPPSAVKVEHKPVIVPSLQLKADEFNEKVSIACSTVKEGEPLVTFLSNPEVESSRSCIAVPLTTVGDAGHFPCESDILSAISISSIGPFTPFLTGTEQADTKPLSVSPPLHHHRVPFVRLSRVSPKSISPNRLKRSSPRNTRLSAKNLAQAGSKVIAASGTEGSCITAGYRRSIIGVRHRHSPIKDRSPVRRKIRKAMDAISSRSPLMQLTGDIVVKTSEDYVVKTFDDSVVTAIPLDTDRSVNRTLAAPLDTNKSVVRTTAASLNMNRSVVRTTAASIDTDRSVVRTTAAPLDTDRPVVRTTAATMDTNRYDQMVVWSDECVTTDEQLPSDSFMQNANNDLENRALSIPVTIEDHSGSVLNTSTIVCVASDRFCDV